MEPAQTAPPAPGSLSWRLSSHPITLLTFLFFRICTSIYPQFTSHFPPLHTLYTSCSQANTYPTHSIPSSLPPRPAPPDLKLRPHLHHHNPTARNGLLLPQEHCRPPPRRA